MQYSSKDFSAVPAKMRCELPEKLQHRDVLNSGNDHRFSSERKHLVAVVDLPSKTMSMTLGGLEPMEITNRHRHSYETILYIVEGHGESVIESEKIEWRKGDAVYIPVWAWHHHRNLSATVKALYIACENAPLLQNLGGIAVREEASCDQ
jgi:gentisate 1,2-dioxygenase